MIELLILFLVIISPFAIIAAFFNCLPQITSKEDKEFLEARDDYLNHPNLEWARERYFRTLSRRSK